MKTQTLIYRNLWYFRKAYFTVFLGTVLATGILTGALIVGDSVKYSLRKLALQRLGKTQISLTTGDRLFRKTLAHNISKKTGWVVSAVHQLEGVVNTGNERANHVQILGVDSTFWLLGKNQPVNCQGPNDVFINLSLAKKLKLHHGDEIIIRVQKINEIPANTPFAQEDEKISMRMTVKGILTPNQMGNFGLEPSQISPNTTFVSIDNLNKRFGLFNKANLLLIASQKENLTIEQCRSALIESWTKDDLSLKIKIMDNPSTTIIKSNRLFIDPAIETVILENCPSAKQHTTYFVNHLKSNERTTPYSFVSTLKNDPASTPLKENEIIISQWLAQDLQTNIGEKLEMAYLTLNSDMSLQEQRSTFKIQKIVPTMQMASDTVYAPQFPGLSDTKNCRDWNPNIPVDLERIRGKDEHYWDQFASTPKAMISIHQAHQIWNTPFGSTTAIQVHLRNQTIQRFSKELMRQLNPETLGFQIRPVRQEALQASKNSLDFGPLFLGLSIFIVFSALILTHLLFSLGIENRLNEIATLMATGFSHQKIQSIFLREGSILAGLGSLVGIILGIGFNHFILLTLKTLWKDAVGTTSLIFHIKALTLSIGCATGALLAISTLFLTIRRSTNRSIKDIYSDFKPSNKWKNMPYLMGMLTCFFTAFFLLGMNFGKNMDTFWAAGPLLLTGCFMLCQWVLTTHNKKEPVTHIRWTYLSLSNIRRNSGKSLAVIILCGLGMFVIIAVGANRKMLNESTMKRNSGTGGFALYGETALPVMKDLNQVNAQKTSGLYFQNNNIRFVQIRLKPGSDASCLNLNHVRMPSILGIPCQELAKRKSFSFVSLFKGFNKKDPWTNLDKEMGSNTLPVFVDHGVMLWSLKKQIGDTLQTVNDQGDTLSLILAGSLQNSIFQGNLLLSENFFTTNFPSIAGSRILLVDAPPEQSNTVQEQLASRLQNYGLEIMPTKDRLAMFLAVENTYLSIFMILGGLGMILGTVGLGILVFRNVLERQSELALMESVGFTRKMLFRFVMTEHAVLLTIGLTCGFISALIALIPSIILQGNEIPIMMIAGLFVIIFLNGLIWTYGASRAALKHDLIPALRKE